MPFTIDDFFTKEEQKNLKEYITEPTDQQEKQHNILIITGYILFGLPLFFFQYILISFAYQTTAGILFSYRAWDNVIYSGIQAIFFSIIILFIVYMHVLNAKQDKESIRDYLLIAKSTPLGVVANFAGLKFYKPAVIGFGIFFTVMNIFVSNTFISINSDKLYFSYFTSLNSQNIKYDSINCIIRYSRRTAPIGSTNFNPYLEIHYDNNILDTFYLIERIHHKKIFKALEKAANRELPYIKIKSIKNEHDKDKCLKEKLSLSSVPKNIQITRQNRKIVIHIIKRPEP